VTADVTESIPVIESAEDTSGNHYKMDASKSANVTLYVTTGEDVRLKALTPGEEFVTQEPNTYFFVRVPDGYAAETTFEHNYAFGDASRSEYPGWGSTKTSIYYGMYDPDDPNPIPPRWNDADQLGCTYKFQYTGKSGNSGNFWTQFAIKAEPIEISIIYDANGGKNAPVDGTIYYHNNVTEYDTHVIKVSSQKPQPADSSKSFYGWQLDNGPIFQAGDEIKVSDIWNYVVVNGKSGSITLKAVWEDKISLSYNGNNNTGGKNVVDKNLYTKGEKAVVLQNTWYKYNYEFTGWNTKADGSGTAYMPDDEIELKANTILYAQWSRKKQVNINYVASAGGSVSRTAESVDPDDGEPLGSTASAKEGYHFVGWTDATGVTVSTDLSFKPVIPENYQDNDITYTAKFAKNQTIDLTADSENVIYDGKPHQVNSFSGNTFIYNGQKYTIEGLTAKSEKATDSGSYTVEILGTAVVKDAAGNDVTDWFNIVVNTGTLTIVPRNITVQAASASKTYDGTPLTDSSVEFVYGSFAEDEGATFVVEGSRTLAGVSDNIITDIQFNDGTNAINYNIITKDGTLTVTDRGSGTPLYEVTITAKSGDFIYDGQEHTVSGFENEDADGKIPVSIGNLTYYVDVTNLTASASMTNAGMPVETSIEGNAVVRDKAGNDVTSQFKVNINRGSLTINPRPVTLKSESASKVYDGKALRAETVTDELTGDSREAGFIEAEKAGVTYRFSDSAQVTQAGSYAANEFKAYFDEKKILSSNYLITYDFGQLHVTDRDAADRYQVTVTAKSGEFTYNGQTQTIKGFVGENSKGLIPVIVDDNGSTMTYYVNVNNVTAIAEGTDVKEKTYAGGVGYYETAFDGSFTVEDSAGIDVTEQFNVTAEPGRLVINPRSVNIATGSATKEYDGTPLTNSDITIEGDGFIDGDLISIRTEGSRLLVGREINRVVYQLRPDMNSINYDITENLGRLTVTDRAAGKEYEITVAAESSSAKYDGKAHNVSGYTVSGTTAVADISESISGYSFTVGGVYYTITGLSAGLETEAVDAGTYTVYVDGSAIIQDEYGNDVTDQFKVNIVDGTLTIGKRNVVMTSETRTEQYSGQILEAPTVEVSGDGFVNGDGASYVFKSSAKAVKPNNTVTNAFEYVLNDGTKAANYDITKIEGTLTLTNREGEARYKLMVEANSGTWTYDGKEHTVGGFKTSDTYMVNGVTYKVSGLSVAEVTAKDYQEGGYAVNVTGTAVVTDENGNDVTDQFIVETKNGTLTINKRPVMLTSASAQKTYDGTALTAESATDSYNVTGRTSEPGFVDGEGAEYHFTGTRTLPGVSENYFTYTLNEGTKESNYIISTTNGALNIQNRAATDIPLYTIVLQPVSAELVYNGTEQSVEGFEKTSFEFDGRIYEVTGIQAVAKGTEPGVYTSVYSGTPIVLDSEGNDVTAQFAIDTGATGTLTIKGIYSLRINYVDTVGTTLAPSYVGRFVEGASFGTIVSPEVAGYIPAYSSVSSPESGMPNRDITVDVVYTAINAVIPTETPVNTPVQTTVNTPDENPAGTSDEGPADTTAAAANAEPTPAQPATASIAEVSVPEVPIPAIPVTDIGEETPQSITIDDEETPKGIIVFDDNGNAEIIEIEDDPTALAAGFGDAAWALINLIAAILTAVTCIVLLIKWFIEKKDDDDEKEPEDDKESKTGNTGKAKDAGKAEEDEDDDDDDDDKKKKRRALLKILSIIPAVASVIIFCITENMRNPMILVDRWTILMIVLLVVEILIAYFSRKKDDEEEDENKDKNINKDKDKNKDTNKNTKMREWRDDV
jgi:uncharacterized repeat protein (TIGR02543 family)